LYLVSILSVSDCNICQYSLLFFSYFDIYCYYLILLLLIAIHC
jgi:hypothetical protein